MKWIWKQKNLHFEKPLGYKPCGLTRGRERPDELYFSIQETHDIFSYPEDKFLRYVVSILGKTRKISCHI